MFLLFPFHWNNLIHTRNSNNTKGDFDPESHTLIKSILDEDCKHVELLWSLLH
jgi:hypothetical protein